MTHTFIVSMFESREAMINKISFICQRMENEVILYKDHFTNDQHLVKKGISLQSKYKGNPNEKIL